MGAQSPQLGYNHNIPHRGRLYHVQTEDSGVIKAHIFTHIFYDGTIISSNKIEYRSSLEGLEEKAEISQVVIGQMQDSHKSMIRRLRRAEFDEKIFAVIGPHPDEEPIEGSDPPPAAAPEGEARPQRRPVPEPREVEPQGPPLGSGKAGPTVDPSLSHPVYASQEARTQVAASAAGHGQKRTSRGPSRIRRRAIGGIGGQGVKAGTTPVTERRDIIVGKFASEHQAQLDEEILTLLREDA
ncbi:MAG: hypothetical protein KUG77_08370 [Nannocystaceae bacterium]|nr:hypothetical protein [Nannocystaceae bacterium]